MPENILLHHCCAVCTPKVLEYFSAQFEKVTGFWFNPNIQPEEEFNKRLGALKTFTDERKHVLIEKKDYEGKYWDNYIGMDTNEPHRCRKCYALRLEATAREAKKMNIGSFSTTLLSSPHQKHDIIVEIGKKAEADTGVKFAYRDFRPEFYEGKNEIYNRKLYMQKYCGCIYSLKERNTGKK